MARAKIRNVSGQGRDVPGHGTVDDDAVIEVDDVESYTCQSEVWRQVSTKKGDD